MRGARSKAVQKFSGQVTFVMIPVERTLKTVIAEDELNRAYPGVLTRFDEEQQRFLVAPSSRVKSYMSAFIAVFGSTSAVEFDIDPTSPDAAALEWFRDWYYSLSAERPRTDHRAAFEGYTQLDESVAEAWADAYNQSRPARLAAPEELQPGAAERAETDADFPNAATA